MNKQSSTKEKTELEKMRSGEMYYFSDPAIAPMFEHAKRICAKLRTRSVYDEDYRLLIEDLIPGLPQSTEVTPPFHCDMGSEIHIGENTFINYNCVMLDAGGITIGKNCLIGPNCSFYTPQHPTDYIERREPKETPYPIHIGDDCWLGGNVTVLPGVTIGDRCIIAAGSVVLHDIPSDCMAAGSPAVVKKHLK